MARVPAQSRLRGPREAVVTYGQLLNRVGQAVTRYIQNHPGPASRTVQPGATLTFKVPTAGMGDVLVTIEIPAPLLPDGDSVTVQLDEPDQAVVVVDPLP